MALGAQLEKILRAKRISLAQVARDTGISRSTLYRMRTRDSLAMRGGLLLRLADYLLVPVEYFYDDCEPGQLGEAAPGQDRGEPLEPYAPPFGCALEDATREAVASLSAECLAVRALDDSMCPDIREGETAIVRRTDRISIGHTGLFEYEGEALLRVLGNGYLLPLNPLYAPLPLGTACAAVGAVVGKASL